MTARKEKKGKIKLNVNNPCFGCGAECCKYFAVYIDEPTDLEEFDAIRWYLHHRYVCVYIDKDADWYVHVDVSCRQQDREGKCRGYDGRPMVCRNYAPKSCERADIEVNNIAEFNSVKELDRFFKLNYRVVGKDLKKRHRSFQTD